MGLILEDINKVVGGESHLSGINLDLAPGSRNVLLGRTLAGKTSLLRIMAGLDRPSDGRILVNGKDETGTFVRNRNVAMVYQQFVNYPSLTIYDNIASPLRLGKLAKSEIDRRVRDAAAMLHLDTMLERRPAELSGGQQQRTAIARALVKDAELLLLDEPLANLDYKLREELREELQQIFKERQAIVVYTTTEPTEALMLGGNVVILDEGRILQQGSTPDVYHHPATTRVAEVFSDPPINYLDGTVADGQAQMGSGVAVSLNGHSASLASGRYRFGVRANHFFLNRTTDSDVAIPATVELSEINGSETFIHVTFGDTALVVQETGIHTRKIGSAIDLFVNPSVFFIYDDEGRLVASPDRAASDRSIS